MVVDIYNSFPFSCGVVNSNRYHFWWFAHRLCPKVYCNFFIKYNCFKMSKIFWNVITPKPLILQLPIVQAFFIWKWHKKLKTGGSYVQPHINAKYVTAFFFLLTTQYVVYYNPPNKNQQWQHRFGGGNKMCKLLFRREKIGWTLMQIRQDSHR